MVQVLPPGRGGVFDYGHRLQSQWASRGIESHVIELSAPLAQQQSLADRIADRLGTAHRAASRCSVVLHYSGYGYASRGLCFWLLEELRALKARRDVGGRLIVVFHELFASGPPWRSAYWTSKLQVWLAKRIARMADALWTNTELHADWLRRVSRPAVPIHVQPVFSNIGECVDLPPSASRSRSCVLFGALSTRQRAMDALPGHLTQLHALGIDELVEVGAGEVSMADSPSLAIRRAGELESSDVCSVLRESRFALLDYPPQLLAKSGVFAACAAQGCIVLNTAMPAPDSDGLVNGVHYVNLSSLPDIDISRVASEINDQIGAQAHRWYAAHTLRHQASLLLSTAAGEPASCTSETDSSISDIDLQRVGP